MDYEQFWRKKYGARLKPGDRPHYAGELFMTDMHTKTYLDQWQREMAKFDKSRARNRLILKATFAALYGSIGLMGSSLILCTPAAIIWPDSVHMNPAQISKIMDVILLGVLGGTALAGAYGWRRGGR